MLAACVSEFLVERDAAAFLSAVGSHDFFDCRTINGTRAIISDVFFGIKHESSPYSIVIKPRNKNQNHSIEKDAIAAGLLIP